MIDFHAVATALAIAHASANAHAFDSELAARKIRGSWCTSWNDYAEWCEKQPESAQTTTARIFPLGSSAHDRPQGQGES